MARMTMIEAVRSAMDISMGRDDDVVVFGEDVGYFGGVFRATQGLQAKYGKTRCFDAPISESGIVGTAIGMASAFDESVDAIREWCEEASGRGIEIVGVASLAAVPAKQ